MDYDTKTQPSNGPRAGGSSSAAGSPGASTSMEKPLPEQAKQAATELAHQAKDKLGSQIDAQKERAAGSIGSVAEALRETGRTMREGDTAFAAKYADQLADRVEQLTSYVRSRNVGELAGDVEQLARREPALFFGGAFAVGLVLGRFLKSSGRNQPVGGSGSAGRELGRGNENRTMTRGQGSAVGAMAPYPTQGQPPIGSSTLAGVGAARGGSPAPYGGYSGSEKGASKP
ncbi:MAG: hypothetical protein M3O50_21730 [Myxococcota bacterium]|nr:hypothetical protein [Myxococcota bacterium]